MQIGTRNTAVTLAISRKIQAKRYDCHFFTIENMNVLFSFQLLTVAPQGNALALVCSELGTQRFVKYVNRSATDDFGNVDGRKPFFVDICGVYHEAKAGSNDDDGGGTSK